MRGEREMGDDMQQNSPAGLKPETLRLHGYHLKPLDYEDSPVDFFLLNKLQKFV